MKLWLELFCWSQSWATGSATVHMGVGVFKASSGSCPKALLAVLSLQVGSARFSLDPLPCTWFSAPVAFILGPDQLRWNPSKARYAEEMQPRSLQRSQHWLGRCARQCPSLKEEAVSSRHAGYGARDPCLEGWDRRSTPGDSTSGTRRM